MTFVPCDDGLPTTGMWKCDPIFADVNGDGYMDLGAIPRLGDGPHVFLGNGNGQWDDKTKGLAPQLTSCGGGMSFADADNDGDLDLLVADHCNGIFVYLGDGAGSWEMVTKGLYPDHLVDKPDLQDMYRGSEDISTGDLNQDGNLDMLVGASDRGGISVYYGDGTGRNWRFAVNELPIAQWANRVEIADVNADGIPDVVASYAEGPRVWLNDGTGELSSSSEGLPTPSIQGLYTGLAVADVNKDGLPDLAVANWVDGPEVYLQQADGSWQKTPDVFPDLRGGAVGLALGDIDNDGNLDMAVSGRLDVTGGISRGVFVLLGDGHGGWRYLPDSGLPNTGLLFTTGLAFADVNGDGTQDLAAGSGLVVESQPGGATEPVLPAHLLFWCNRTK